jgi:hypothetical protein
MGEIIARYVRFEKNPMLKYVPLFVKTPLIGIGFNAGEKGTSTTFSNLGVIALPQSMCEHISHFESVIYPTRKSPVVCTVCSVNDRLTITFNRSIVERDIPQFFFSYLAESAGLDVTVYSNNWGKQLD